MKRDRLYKTLKEVRREIWIKIVVMLIVGGSAPWWITVIPWEPFRQYVTTVEVVVELKEGTVSLLLHREKY